MAMARIRFRMSVEEFLDITPRFFSALLKQEEEQRKADQHITEVMGAQIVAMVRRCGFMRFDEQLGFSDFMPTVWAKRLKEKPKRITRAERLREIEQQKAYWKRAAKLPI